MIFIPDCVSFQALMLKQEQEDLLVEQRKLEQAVSYFFSLSQFSTFLIQSLETHFWQIVSPSFADFHFQIVQSDSCFTCILWVLATIHSKHEHSQNIHHFCSRSHKLFVPSWGLLIYQFFTIIVCLPVCRWNKQPLIKKKLIYQWDCKFFFSIKKFPEFQTENFC